MSIRLTTVDLSAAIVSTTGTVSWSLQHISPALSVQMLPTPHTAVHIQLYNESGCGILINFAGDTNTSFIPAGGWRTFAVGPDIQQYTWTVDYVLQNAPVNKLYTIWYAPGEMVDETGILGNSPIGGAANVLNPTQVVQDGQAAGAQIVESTPGFFHQSVLITTDGIETLTPATPGSGVQDAYRVRQAGDGNVPARISAGLRSDGFGFLQSSDSTIPNRSRLWGSVGGGWNTDVPFANVNGQASVGTFGVPMIVAQALRVAVTVTSIQSILTYTPTVAGLYRVSGYVEDNGSVNNTALLAAVSYADDLGFPAPDFATWTGGASPLHLNGTNTFVFGSGYALIPLTFYAVTGTNIVCQYRNPGGVPNDHVWYLIERLA